jgi:hypothetical protein
MRQRIAYPSMTVIAAWNESTGAFVRSIPVQWLLAARRRALFAGPYDRHTKRPGFLAVHLLAKKQRDLSNSHDHPRAAPLTPPAADNLELVAAEHGDLGHSLAQILLASRALGENAIPHAERTVDK